MKCTHCWWNPINAKGLKDGIIKLGRGDLLGSSIEKSKDEMPIVVEGEDGNNGKGRSRTTKAVVPSVVPLERLSAPSSPANLPQAPSDVHSPLATAFSSSCEIVALPIGDSHL